jgi:hypothetical protein
MSKEKSTLKQTYKEMAPAIFVAMIATGLGFLALYTSDVPMIADFGKMLTLGIVVSFVIASLFLLPLLFVRDHHFDKRKSNNKNNKNNNNNKKRTNYLYKFTKIVLKLKYFILFLGISLAIFGIVVDQKVRVETDVETFMPQDSKALDDIHELRDRMGSTDQISIIFKSDNIISNEHLDTMTSEINYLTQTYSSNILQINSLLSLAKSMDYDISEESLNSLIEQLPEAQTKTWINEENTYMVIQLMIEKMQVESLEDFIDELNNHFEENRDEDLSVIVTGQATIDVSMISSLTSGRYVITLLGMLAVFLGLLIIYRNPIRALTPLVPITLIIGWSGLIMYMLDIAYTPLTATLGALIIGIGTEFTILIIDRFEKNKKDYMPVDETIADSIQMIGKPILISAITTIGGFSALIISDFEILKNFGIMTVINLVLAVIATLIMMPVILYFQARIRFKYSK